MVTIHPFYFDAPANEWQTMPWGGIILFFRIVASRYKKKKYQYLRLMESYRDGDKVKQKELMTLANLTETHPNNTNDILDSLRQLISISNSISSYTGGSAQVSLLLALEAAFQPKKICPVNILEETLSREKEKKTEFCRDGDLFFRLITKYHSRQPENTDLILWFNKACAFQGDDNIWIGYLMNISGFPYKYYLFDRNDRGCKKIVEILNNCERAFNTEHIWTFLPTYSNAIDSICDAYPDGFTHTNVVICQQRSKQLEYPYYSAEQYTLINNARVDSPQKTREVINTTINFLKYYHWHIERMNSIRDYSIEGENYFDMCIMLHLFGRLIEQNIISKYTLPVREKYKNSYRYVSEMEQPAFGRQQFNHIAD